MIAAGMATVPASRKVAAADPVQGVEWVFHYGFRRQPEESGASDPKLSYIYGDAYLPT